MHAVKIGTIRESTRRRHAAIVNGHYASRRSNNASTRVRRARKPSPQRKSSAVALAPVPILQAPRVIGN